jgi:hypothetical protein
MNLVCRVRSRRWVAAVTTFAVNITGFANFKTTLGGKAHAGNRVFFDMMRTERALRCTKSLPG